MPPPTLLELFSGSGSISEAFREHGWHTITLDSDPRCGADIQMSILDFQPSAHLISSIPKGSKIDLVWASPLCTYYSTFRRNRGPPTAEQLEFADSLVRKAVQLAQELQCPILLENPWTGELKNRGIPELLELKMCRVDYCRYGYPHRKRTGIWTDTSWQPARPLCKYDCPGSSIDPVTRRKKHAANWDRMPQKGRAVIPWALCEEIAAHFSR